MSNVLVYAPFSLSTPHFETDLELAAIALEKGDNVTFYTCDGSLPICELNPNHEYLVCQMCKARAQEGLKWLRKKQKNIVTSTFDVCTEELDLIQKIVNRPFASIAEIKAFLYDGSDIGMSAISSVVSYLREPKISLTSNLTLIRKHLETALIAHFSIKKTLTSGMFDEVKLYNARFSALRPVLRAARMLDIDVFVHERGPYMNQYVVIKNFYPHDISMREQQLLDIKKNNDEDTIQKIGKTWFEERFSNKQQNWRVFTDGQDMSLSVPTKNDRINVAIFNSSEDEFEAVRGYENLHYRDQNDGIRKILNDTASLKCNFILRAHPNLKNIDNTQTRELVNISHEFSDLTYIPPESKVSTYELIKQSDLIIVFGSTVGVEAAYLNKPVFIMGETPYQVLECCIKPKDHNELITMISDYITAKRFPKVKNDAAIYGYWAKTRGIKFEFIQQTDVFKACVFEKGKCKKLNDSIKYLTFSMFFFLKRQVKRSRNLFVFSKVSRYLKRVINIT